MAREYIKYLDNNLNGISRIAVEVALQKEKSMRTQTAEEYRISQNVLADVRTISATIKTQKEEIAGVPCEWVSHRIYGRTSINDYLIIYIHGGSWMFGNLDTARPVAQMLIKETAFKVLMIDYRRAPEHPYPAGFSDVCSVYDQLVQDGHNTNKILLFGDSAGGNYSLALLNRLKAENRPMPKCVALASPATDLQDSSSLVSSGSDLLYTTHNGKEENIFHVYLGEEYYNKRELTTISPVTADLSGLPPVLIHTGGAEPLLQDNIDYAEKMHDAGGDVFVKIWKDMFHDFTIVGSALKESRESLKEIGDFYHKHTLQQEN